MRGTPILPGMLRVTQRQERRPNLRWLMHPAIGWQEACCARCSR
jgi:hypothetical protein